MGAECHEYGRNNGDQGKDYAVDQPRIHSPVPVKDSFPVITQGDCNYWKVCADCKNWEESQEVADKGDADDITVAREVEGVHVLQVTEAEDGGER